MTNKTESLKINPFHEDKLYDRIADTYFHQKTRQKSRKKKVNPILKYLKPALIGLTSSALILVVSLSGMALYQVYTIYSLKNMVAKSTVVMISDGGQVNKEILKNTEFRGFAKENSSFSKECIILKNPKKYNWAEVAFNFKIPLDLSARRLSMFLKGKVGGERVSLIIRDSYNRSLRISDISVASSWKEETFSLAAIRNNIDLSKITHFRLEYGYIGESPKDMDSPIGINVYLKDIKITKES